MVDILTTLHGNEIGLQAGTRALMLKSGIVRSTSGAPIYFPEGVAADLTEFSVKRYGAVGDGNDANVVADTDGFWEAWQAAAPTKSPVYIPNGHYFIGETLPLAGTDLGVTWWGESLNNNLAEATEVGGVILELADATNAHLMTVAAECAPIHFRNIYFRGNQAGQSSGTSRAVHFTDAVSASRSGEFYNCRGERWRNGAIYAGTYRDAGKMNFCVFLNNGFDNQGDPVGGTGADGLLFGACNDWRLFVVDSGANTRHGYYYSAPGTLDALLCNAFSNQNRGIQIDGTAGGVRLLFGSIDRNLKDGISIVGSTASTKTYLRRLYGLDWSGNGVLTNDTYADIKITDDPRGTTHLFSPSFSKGASANLPKYNIQTAGTTDLVRVLFPEYLTDANAPYATAFTNDVTKLFGMLGQKPTITGAWNTGAAGVSLAAALEAMGLITDNTTAS